MEKSALSTGRVGHPYLPTLASAASAVQVKSEIGEEKTWQKSMVISWIL
jgi:hypothetical protein